MTQRCSRLSYRGGWPRNCTREATVQIKGQWLCPAHARGQARSDAAQAQRRADAEARRERTAVATERCKAISTALGITVATAGHGGGYGIVLLDELEGLVARIK